MASIPMLGDHVVSSSSTSKTTAPPTQSFADFKFTTIGQQPKLLERISAPDPSIEYIQYQVTPSPTPTPRLGSHVLPSVDAAHDLPSSRRTLFQALAISARDEDGDVIMNSLSSPSTSIAVRTDLGLEMQVTPLLLPTESTVVQPAGSESTSNLHENATITPSLASLWPTPAESRSTPSYSQDVYSTRLSSTLTEGPASSSSSLGLQYPPQDSSYSHTPTPTATPQNIDEPEGTESPYTALRALQVRLQASLSSLSPTPSSSDPSSSSIIAPKSSPAQEALLLAQSAHTKSASALSTAHHAHTLAQQALKSVQESLVAAQSCLAAAEEASESAKEAMSATERIKEEEEERNVWWRKEMLDGVQKDLEELGVWVGQREGEEATLRRQKEAKERAEKDREAVERAMNLHKNRNGNGKGVEGMVDQADEGAAENPRKQRKLERGGEREEEEAEEVEIKMIMRKEEEAEQRAAEIEADLARRGWEGVAARGDSRRRSSEAATTPYAPQNLENESNDVPMDLDSSTSIPHLGSTSSPKSVEASSTTNNSTRLTMSAHERERSTTASFERNKAILASQKQQQAEKLEIERQEAERRSKEEEEMKVRQKVLEDQRALQEMEKLEKERAKAAEIQEQERDAELRREQDKKRAEIMLQKQLANAATAAKIRADRERESAIAKDKDKQPPSSGSPANSAGPSVPSTPAKNSKKQSQKTPSGKVGNLVARQTLTTPVPVPVPEKRKPTSGNVKLSDKTVPQGPKAATLATSSSARQNVTATDQFSAPPLPVPGPSSSSSKHNTTSIRSDHDLKLAANHSSKAGRQDAGPAPTTISSSAAPNHNGLSSLESNPWVRRTESPLFRRASLPPIEHISSEHAASVSSSSTSPSIILSLNHTGSDSGNLAMDTMLFPPTLSHDAQATNLRHILEPRGISWNPKRRPEDVKPKSEFDDEEDIPLAKTFGSSQKVKKETSTDMSPAVQPPKPQTNIQRQPTSSQTSTSSSTQMTLPPSSSPKKVIPPPRRKLPPINFKRVQDAPPQSTPQAQNTQPMPVARQKPAPLQPAAMSNDHSYSQPLPNIRTSSTLHDRLSEGPSSSNSVPANPDASALHANEVSPERFSFSPPRPSPEIIGDGGWAGPSHDGYANSPRWSESADNSNYYSPSPEPYHRRGGDHYSPPPPLPASEVPRGPRALRRTDADVYIPPATHARQSPLPPPSLSPPPQLGRKRPRESDWEADYSNTRRRENQAYNPRDDRRASPPPRSLDPRRPYKETIPERRDVSRGSRGDSYRPAYGSSSRVEDNVPNDYPASRPERGPPIPDPLRYEDLYPPQEHRQNANPPQKTLLARFSDPHPPAPFRNHKKSNDRSQAPPRGPNKPRGGRGHHGPLANRLASANTLLKRMA